ncbi:MAG TPA: outer membrane protein assembly factor BamD, partial [Candidatus Acidoferrales bacterium]|nr:outer membrane protein assembly factor BamD [Candidatus Acidoferrales bacterium]
MKPRFKIWLAASVLASFLPAGCLFSGHKNKAKIDTNASAAPDKILYDRAVEDYKHGRYIESRLSLQTLINSYPDSEYLAKAKLAVADSYFKEGGIDGLTQAVQEYKDFITFFPFLDEASYAQMQVAMSHFRMMEKADRDPTHARLAEQEFQTFLLKYPKSPLVPQATQHLRDVQEILGEADFDVARFYYIKGDFRASAGRLIEVTNRYP